MQFFTTMFVLAAAAVAVSAANVNVEREPLERRITDPGNPANLINCPPGGGADACNLEQPVGFLLLQFTIQHDADYVFFRCTVQPHQGELR